MDAVHYGWVVDELPFIYLSHEYFKLFHAKMTISLVNQPELVDAEKDHDEWLKNVYPYYSNSFCLKRVPGSGCRARTLKTSLSKIEGYISDEANAFTVEKCLCVLPKGHSGKCQSTYDSECKIIERKLNYIHVTEGEAKGPLKNRMSRLYPVRLSKKSTKYMKDRGVYDAAIPIENSSTPEGVATCLIDIFTYIQKVKGEFVHPLFELHWFRLRARYPLICRDDTLVCPVIGSPITMEMITQNARENETGVQIGHLNCRNERSFTIRGMNVFLMTRWGNRLVGEERFDSPLFRQRLRKVADYGA